MTPKAKWRAAFLTLTALTLGLEVFAATDGNPNTDPWTDLIVAYIPGEVAAALGGALLLWLPIHFGIRYWRRHRDRSVPLQR